MAPSETRTVLGIDQLAVEMLDQQGDILAALAQGRQGDADDVEAVEEILAESAAADLVFQILVGGGDQAHIDLDVAGAAHPAEFALLQHAQQLDLHHRRQFADFIEKQGAAVGDLEEAGLLLDGAGEGAFFVAEEFALEQVFGDGAAVDGDEGVLPPLAVVMDRLGDQFLAGAAFAGHQDVDPAAGDFLDEVVDPLHRLAFADQTAEGVTLAEFLLERLRSPGAAPAAPGHS